MQASLALCALNWTAYQQAYLDNGHVMRAFFKNNWPIDSGVPGVFQHAFCYCRVLFLQKNKILSYFNEISMFSLGCAGTNLWQLSRMKLVAAQ